MSDGVRSVERALQLLEIAAAENSLRLTDFVSRSDLQKTTVLRLLRTLVDCGYLELEADYYRLGPSLIRLATKSVPQIDHFANSSRVVHAIAEECGDSVYLSLRAGENSVCIEAANGDYPVKTLTLRKGDVRPLGVGAGSLAVLSALGETELDKTLPIAAELAREWRGFDQASLRRAVEQTRKQGYALNPSKIIPGVTGIGIPIFSSSGVVLGALSVASLNERMGLERLGQLKGLLERSALRIAEYWSPIESDLERLTVAEAQECLR